MTTSMTKFRVTFAAMEIDETPPRSRSEEICASTYVTQQYVTQRYVTKQQKEQHLEKKPEANSDSEQTHHQMQPDLQEESHTNGHVRYTNVMLKLHQWVSGRSLGGCFLYVTCAQVLHARGVTKTHTLPQLNTSSSPFIPSRKTTIKALRCIIEREFISACSFFLFWVF